jgi:hypothetical protein
MTKKRGVVIDKWHGAGARRTAALVIIAVASMSGGGRAMSQTVAFPGAVGQGAAAVGGRGGDVYHVTNLDDFNEGKGEAAVEGSLRQGIRSADGPRTIVFDVGGAIRLHAPLEIRKSQLTIAGQTAPGGITAWAYPINISSASDVVVRYVRARTGDFNARAPKNSKDAKAPKVGKGNRDLDASSANGFDVIHAERVILDHVSAAWGMDETLSVTHSRDVTIQNSIIAQSLNHSFHPKGPHGYGSLVRGDLTAEDQEAGVGGYTFYGNLWAFHVARNPSFGGQQTLTKDQPESARRRGDMNLVNSVIYGWGERPTHRNESGEVRANLVGNYYINGPMKHADYIFFEGNKARTSLYHQGNMLDDDQDGKQNGHPVGLADDVRQTFRDFGPQDLLVGPTHGKPFNFFATVAKDVVPAGKAYREVIQHAGACLPRDPVDARIVESVIHRTGSLVDSQESLRRPDGTLAGIDDVPTTKRPAGFDSDGDGMSDTFELKHGLDPHDSADRNGNKLSKEGYTNLEVYLSELAPVEK